MIITISGIAGSGKSTVAKLLAKKLNLKHYSVGDFMREIARERGITLLELSNIAEKDNTIDKELDKKQIELGKKEDNFVIDSRLGFHFIPNSIKIFLDADIEEAAKRILKEKREHEQYKDIQESIEKIKTRIASEDKRYMEYYSVDYHNKGNYEIVIDTTNISPDEVADIIVNKINR
ncbi:MAG: cytidylate kinase family protein [Nanoarchaeota archaeon]|nr:cytidylate kinase family protein [Nanoarchaeota archaeon]MBU1004754.1 cytidylate kinase family protein [Nanoarchaeota archaeon]MBU1945769.1 cytidylate kinase family protein [Nanoarchaeota archaeon]